MRDRFLHLSWRTRTAERWHGLPSESFGFAVNTPTQTITHSHFAASALASTFQQLHCVVQAAWRILCYIDFLRNFPFALLPTCKRLHQHLLPSDSHHVDAALLRTISCCLHSKRYRFSSSHPYCPSLSRFRIRIICQVDEQSPRVIPPGRRAR